METFKLNHENYDPEKGCELLQSLDYNFGNINLEQGVKWL